MPLEKPLSCAWWVWKAEKDYENLIEIIDKVEAGEEKYKGFIDYSLKLLRESYDKVKDYCGIDIEESKEDLEDAEWHLSSGNWLDAKWSLLFASAHLLDEIRRGVRKERGKI
jgi:hypothetical protein